MIKLKISFNISMAYFCYKFCQLYWKTKQEFDVVPWLGNGEKFSLLRKSAISIYIYNEFRGKFKENYWKLGQIGQNLKIIKTTIEYLYLEPLNLEISLCRTKYLVPRMHFQANFLSLSRNYLYLEQIFWSFEGSR